MTEAELADAYADLFDEKDELAATVMTDLARQFGYVGKAVYDPNEQNAQGNCVYRGGQQSVLQYIAFMVHKGKENAQTQQIDRVDL